MLPSVRLTSAVRRLVASGGAGLLCAGCQPPTQITLAVTTDVPCDAFGGTGITVGVLGQIEDKPPATTTSACDASGRIGSLVVIPADEDDDELALKLVGAMGGALEPCLTAPYAAHCIVARRALNFIPRTPLRIPVPLRSQCAGVQCPIDHTCVQGSCVPAHVDPESCTGPEGCGEGASPMAAVPGWVRRFGAEGDDVPTALGLLPSVALTGTTSSEVLYLGGPPLPRVDAFDRFLAAFAVEGQPVLGEHQWSSRVSATKPFAPPTAHGAFMATSNVLTDDGQPTDTAQLMLFGTAGELLGAVPFTATDPPSGPAAEVTATHTTSAQYLIGGDPASGSAEIIVAGTFRGTLTVGDYPPLTSVSASGVDGYVVAFDYFTNAIVQLYHLAPAADGDVHVASLERDNDLHVVGDFAGPDLTGSPAGPVLGSASQRTGFVVTIPITEAGPEWAEPDGFTVDAGDEVHVDSFACSGDDLYVGGRFRGALAGLESGEGLATFVLAYGPAYGDVHAQRVLPGVRQTVALAAGADLRLCGVHDGPVGFAGGSLPSPVGEHDVVVAGLALPGLETAWAASLKSAEEAWPVELTALGEHTLVTGFYEGPLEIDLATLLHAGGKDVFLVARKWQ